VGLHPLRRSTRKPGEVMSEIKLHMIEEDFEQMVHTSMPWGGHWIEQINRFEPAPMLHWRYAYWVDNFMAVLLCRAYLTTQNCETQTVWDRAFNCHLILTNYETQTWRA
jgi:hypothetical protein